MILRSPIIIFTLIDDSNRILTLCTQTMNHSQPDTLLHSDVEHFAKTFTTTESPKTFPSPPPPLIIQAAIWMVNGCLDATHLHPKTSAEFPPNRFPISPAICQNVEWLIHTTTHLWDKLRLNVFCSNCVAHIKMTLCCCPFCRINNIIIWAAAGLRPFVVRLSIFGCGFLSQQMGNGQLGGMRDTPLTLCCLISSLGWQWWVGRWDVKRRRKTARSLSDGRQIGGMNKPYLEHLGRDPLTMTVLLAGDNG